ncbi:MAG: hypothetical protein KAJ96_09240, partial [Candidatus Thorarchaeota archaeon]|nr:hypothetical protein [Candidatus Thorarchaeota archaeon]
MVSSVIIALVLMIPLTGHEADTSSWHHQSPGEPGRTSLELADVGGTGEDADSTLFMSRTFSDMQLSILNTYAATAKHNETLDLTEYLLPGWTLYNATMMLNNLTAAPEREVVGVDPQATENFKIEEINPPGDVYSEELAQGFYDQSYNGSLLNYSIRYRATGYDPDYYGYAFHTIRSEYNVSSTNITSHVNVSASIPYVWLTLNGNNANLSQDTVYWVMIDGTNLVEYLDNYPVIYWSSEDSTGEFDTAIFLITWLTGRSNEALLNYTYVPWDQATNSALVFANPQDIALRANSTSATDPSVWSFSSPDKNITLVNFDSNQSVYIYHNLTLWYKRSATAQTDWHISTSGSNVAWNQTLTTAYPSIAGIDARYVNFTRMTDW